MESKRWRGNFCCGYCRAGFRRADWRQDRYESRLAGRKSPLGLRRVCTLLAKPTGTLWSTYITTLHLQSGLPVFGIRIGGSTSDQMGAKRLLPSWPAKKGQLLKLRGALLASKSFQFALPNLSFQSLMTPGGN
jgi:hypothetical protein